MTAYPTVTGPSAEEDPVLAQLLEQLRERHNDAICGVLVYGSCLRSGNIYDGLLDLYLICDNYSAAYGSGFLAGANWLLPPNVFYAETSIAEQTLRAKVTVISLRDFQRGCSRAWFESYIWGRFSQPTHLLYYRDQDTREQIEDALLNAALTLLQRALPALPPEGSVTDLWEQALGLSYATELRTERSGRASELATSSAAFYNAVTRLHADSLALDFTVHDAQGETSYRCSIGQLRRRGGKLAWAIRRVQGKVMSVSRLVKALFTFEGGLDYIAWKLERHSGEKIVIPDRVRRAPLIFLWGFFWGLYRRGIFK